MHALISDGSWATPDGEDESDSAGQLETRKHIVRVAQALANQEKESYSLVTITASKQIHFTVPENGPEEIWQLLTWTAPAFLFTFINLAVCLAPHLLLARDKSNAPAGPKISVVRTFVTT
jgi:hypothetical protein